MVAFGLHRSIIDASSACSMILHRQHIMLRINTLGGWGLTRSDGTPQVIPAQRVALVALLVVSGDRGVTRDKAAALLWPESSDENARHSLGQAVYALRRDAASPDVVLGSTTLRLNSDVVTCDAWELSAAARDGDSSRVAELYAGPFLEGVRLRGSAELEHLMDAERDRLAALLVQSVETLARTAASEGDSQVAIAWWRRLAAAQPLSSRTALELVRCLAGAGDRTAALDAARVHETLVREELEADPDPAFAAFVEALRRDVSSMPAARRTRAEQAMRVESTVGASGSLPEETTVPNVIPAASPMRRMRRLTGASIVAAASVVGVVGGPRYFRTTAPLDSTRVYVAWFENRTGDSALAPIAGMARDWVSQGLEKSGVVTIASAARAEDASRPRPMGDGMEEPSVEATRLGAGTVVSGAYYKVGSGLRFHVELSDVARGEVLDSFDATGDATADPVATLEAVRQRTLGSLASVVDPRLASWVRVASKPPTYDAYREFVAGQSIWGSDHRQALVHFLRAAELDSTFYAARVEAATLHRLLGECARTEAISRELGAVREHLAPYEYHVLDEQVAQCAGDWDRAYRQALAVAELRPGSAFLEYSLALQAMQLGRFGEAKQLLDRHTLDRGVAEVGPNYAIIYAQLATVRGDRARGLDVVRWLKERNPGYGPAWAMEVTFLARAGRAEATERLVDTMVATRLEPRAAIVNGLRRAAASLTACGDTAAARRLLTQALAALDATPQGRSRADRAQVLYELGRLDEAASALREIVAADSANVDARGYLGLIAARRGDSAEATAIDAWLDETRTPYVFTRTMYRARIAGLLGNRERALALLGPALDEQNRFLVPGVREYAEFASLRSDERFARLLTSNVPNQRLTIAE